MQVGAGLTAYREADGGSLALMAGSVMETRGNPQSGGAVSIDCRCILVGGPFVVLVGTSVYPRPSHIWSHISWFKQLECRCFRHNQGDSVARGNRDIAGRLCSTISSHQLNTSTCSGAACILGLNRDTATVATHRSADQDADSRSNKCPDWRPQPPRRRNVNWCPD